MEERRRAEADKTFEIYENKGERADTEELQRNIEHYFDETMKLLSQCITKIPISHNKIRSSFLKNKLQYIHTLITNIFKLNHEKTQKKQKQQILQRTTIQISQL